MELESTIKVSTSIALAPDLRDRLDAAAQAADRSRSWIAGRAIAEYLARAEAERERQA